MADIAIFDLDYTLTKRGTWGRFVIKNVKYKPWLWLPLIVSVSVTQWRYKRGKLPRLRVKQAMMRWSMAGQSQDYMQKLAEEFATAEVSTGLRPGAIQAIDYHKTQGDTLIIASAAVDLIVAPIAKKLNIPLWVATEMNWENAKLTTNFRSPNCYGPEKLTRVKQLLATNPELKQNHTIITMYSDSYSDLDILRFSDKGVVVNADKKLKEAAQGENFDIVEW